MDIKGYKPFFCYQNLTNVRFLYKLVIKNLKFFICFYTNNFIFSI